MSIRLGFSTLGCSGASLEEIIRIATEQNAFGVELRAAAGEAVDVSLSRGDAERAGALLAASGLVPVAVASYVALCEGSEAEDAAVAADLAAHLRLASWLGSTGVRVFMKDADAAPESGALTPGEQRAVARLEAVASVARSTGTRVLIETHDSHSTTKSLVRFLEAAGVDSSVVGVLWDTAHSWSHGEAPEQSLDALGSWLAHLQIKDELSVAEPRPVELGAGSYPVRELAAALHARSWQGWAVLEWERKWHPELSALDAALAAAHDWARSILEPEER